MKWFPFKTCLMVLSALFLAPSAWTAVNGSKVLRGHVPRLPANLRAFGDLGQTNELTLAWGLPLRDPRGLQEFLRQVYDPASTNYQRYLTPAEFTERFGPTTNDYQAVINFARANHLLVAATHNNRLVLDVKGKVADLEQALQIKLRRYHHPKENRDFRAPDREPSVPLNLPLVDISGLTDYQRPQPHLQTRSLPAAKQAKALGSGPGSSYWGGDFRSAYLPGVQLTGAGQTVGLLQFDGFYYRDIQTYAAAAGLTVPSLQVVLVDGYDGWPSDGNIEVCLDIEMAMCMAPGLSKIVVFEAGPYGYPVDVLNTMVSSNSIKQFSCSWGWGGGPNATVDNIFQQMAAQGQSFFNASGDSDAFTVGTNSANGVDDPNQPNSPSSNPYITQVGGTTLTTASAGGAWAGETVWNWGYVPSAGGYVGSSGGVSSYYTIPDWQTNLAMNLNGGSTVYRNTPDVALTGDNVYVTYDNGSAGVVGGTSCAAPLWAGVMALINENAVNSGRPSVGFLNPTLYRLVAGGNPILHDITVGNNFSSDSPTNYPAVGGYDLCTGLGTPNGQALLNQLSGVTNNLGLLPGQPVSSGGPVGGSFLPGSTPVILTNRGNTSLAWSLINTSTWLTVSTSNGNLNAGSGTQLTAGLTTNALGLTPGIYTASLLASNTGGALPLAVTLNIGQSLLLDGDFENGGLTFWNFTGATTTNIVIFNGVQRAGSGLPVVHSGNYGMFLGDINPAYLSQNFATRPGQYYLVAFWLINPTSGANQLFNAQWVSGGLTNTLLNFTNPPGFGWTRFAYLTQAVGANATLAIQAQNPPNFFGLDDMTVTPLPAPEFQSVAPVGSGAQLSWNTATGLVYQVQYKTNLLQPNWQALSAAAAATNFNATLLDGTNAAGARFYRLQLSQ